MKAPVSTECFVTAFGSVRQQDLHHQRGLRPGLANSRVQRSLADVRCGTICVRAIFKQEFAEPPVAVEASDVQAEIVAERLQRFSFAQKKFDGAYVAVIGAPFERRDAVLVSRIGGMSCGEIIEDEVSAPVDNFVEHGHQEEGYKKNITADER